MRSEPMIRQCLAPFPLTPYPLGDFIAHVLEPLFHPDAGVVTAPVARAAPDDDLTLEQFSERYIKPAVEDLFRRWQRGEPLDELDRRVLRACLDARRR